MSPCLKSIYRFFAACVAMLTLAGNCEGQHLHGEYSRMFNYWSQEYFLFSDQDTFGHFVTNPGDTSFGVVHIRSKTTGRSWF